MLVAMSKSAPVAAALALAALASALSLGLALGAPGDLDASFDGDGRRTIDYGGADSGQAVALQPDGKIVVAGYGGANTAMQVTRLNPDGSLDLSFGDGGTGSVDFFGRDLAYALAVQPDGKIVLVGETRAVAAAANVAVARLNPNGTPDFGFDVDGIRVIDLFGDDRGQAVALQPDGKILVAGFGGAFGNAITVTRLNPDGTVDMGFGDGGTGGVDLGGLERAFGMALQRDGKIVVAGDRFPPGGGARDVVVARLVAGGSPDLAFGINGSRVIDAGGDDGATAVTLQPDGKIVLAGSAGPSSAMAVTRLNPNGSDDDGFDGDGTSLLDFGAVDAADAVALQPDGKIVVAGSTGGADLAIGRLQPGGSPDTTFDLDGRRTVDFGAVDRGNGLALDRSGRIIVAGETNAGDDVAIARLEGADPPAGAGAGAGRGVSAGGRAAPRCAGTRATIVGTSRRDVLRGTRRADVIVALGGGDVVRAGAGKDLVCGGAGGDRLLGQRGADRLLGQGGRDRLLGGPAIDVLRGGPGRDRLTQ
jgi:uncharacterized delta-60 repeat protein